MASVGLVELPFRIIILHNRKLKVTKSTPDHKQRDVVCNLRARKRERLMQFEINFVHNIKNNLNKRNIL